MALGFKVQMLHVNVLKQKYFHPSTHYNKKPTNTIGGRKRSA